MKSRIRVQKGYIAAAALLGTMLMSPTAVFAVPTMNLTGDFAVTVTGHDISVGAADWGGSVSHDKDKLTGSLDVDLRSGSASGDLFTLSFYGNNPLGNITVDLTNLALTGVDLSAATLPDGCVALADRVGCHAMGSISSGALALAPHAFQLTNGGVLNIIDGSHARRDSNDHGKSEDTKSDSNGPGKSGDTKRDSNDNGKSDRSSHGKDRDTKGGDSNHGKSEDSKGDGNGYGKGQLKKGEGKYDLSRQSSQITIAESYQINFALAADPPQQVPEPGTLSIFGVGLLLGLGFLGWARRRRRL